MVHTCKVMGSCIWDKWKFVVCHYFSKHKYVFQFSRDQNPDFSGKVRRVQTQFKVWFFILDIESSVSIS